jgi:hypothetical protein
VEKPKSNAVSPVYFLSFSSVKKLGAHKRVQKVDYGASGSHFRRYPAEEGFKEEETHDLTLDSVGNLWIGSRSCLGHV